MTPLDTANPLVVAAWVFGVILSLPMLYAILKFVFFIAAITNKVDNTAKALESTVAKLDGFMTMMSSYRHETREKMQEFELVQAVQQTDITNIKVKLDLPHVPLQARREA